MSYQKQVEEGYEAYNEKDKDYCPYEEGTDEYDAWLAGWYRAALDNHPNPRIRAIRRSYKERAKRIEEKQKQV